MLKYLEDIEEYTIFAGSKTAIVHHFFGSWWLSNASRTTFRRTMPKRRWSGLRPAFGRWPNDVSDLSARRYFPIRI